MTNPEYEITHAAIRYAMQCILDENRHALLEMGFGTKECEAISQLSVADLLRLERRITGHALRIQLNQDLFWSTLAEIQRDRSEEKICIDLLKCDAPADLIRELYGIGEKQYARLRRIHGAPKGVGRPSELKEDEAWTLSEVLSGYTGMLSPSDWLAVAKDTGLSLRVIWPAFKRWQIAPTPYSKSSLLQDAAGIPR